MASTNCIIKQKEVDERKSHEILIPCPHTAILSSFSQWAVISPCPLKESRIMKEVVNMFKIGHRMLITYLFCHNLHVANTHMQ